MKGTIAPLTYAVVAPLLLLSQHGLVALLYWIHRLPLALDEEFWLLPLRRLATMPGLSAMSAALAFAFSLLATWALALISFRRASRARRGFPLAAVSIVPVIQFPAVALLALMPRRPVDADPESEEASDVSYVLQGVLAGVAIIVFAVLVSAVTFGAYGWGLFVLTPFTVGVTTAYLANRGVALEVGHTLAITMAALGLGGLALVAFALEGLVCIVLAAPLAGLVAALGALIGRWAAIARHDPGRPFLTVALLPAVFAAEAAIPPSVAIATHESIVISAPPEAVWRAVISVEPLSEPAGLVGRAGLAYPLSGRILGAGVEAERLGYFSTGLARERITSWSPGRRIAFEVLSQPPAMEEMSPYRRVHAPHVQGYFDTGETSFDLEPMPGGRTRLTVRASHVLRIDPVVYWEPIARWAVGANTRRALRSLKHQAESEQPIRR